MYNILQTDAPLLILLEAGGLRFCHEIQRMDTILQQLNSFMMTFHLQLKSKVLFELLIFEQNALKFLYLDATFCSQPFLLFYFAELQTLHNQVFQTAGKWFAEMSESMKVSITNQN